MTTRTAWVVVIAAERLATLVLTRLGQATTKYYKRGDK